MNSFIAKQLTKSFFLFLFLFCVGTTLTMHESASQADSHLFYVTQNAELRKKITAFIDNVVKQTPSEKILKLVDECCLTEGESLYAYLLENITKIQSLILPYYQLRALDDQKEILSKQAAQLLHEKTCIENCVEIGTPAPYIAALKNEHSVVGKVYAILDKERLSDPLQAYSFNPFKLFRAYDQYVPMNNYEPISEDDIPSGSIDLVICFIGLHHIPHSKLEAYVQSLYRIIRPGGSLILRDHDAKDADTLALVDAAHSMFNVIVSKTSVVDNQQEIRNFQPLEYWIELLGAHGFTVGEERLLQNGDPTLNTMMRFDKQPRTEKEYIVTVSSKIKNNPIHTRALVNTFLTAPEWFNVDASQEYGDYINHTPFYKFPYFSYIAAYWKVFSKSWNAARKRKGNLAVLTSDSTSMNLFVGISMTIEYAAKGLMSLPVAWMYTDEEPLHLSMLIKDPEHEITRFGKRISIVESHAHDLYLVKVPRYKGFLELMKQLVDTTISIVEIAGQQEIQCKIRYNKDRKTVPTWNNGICEYIWELPTQADYTYATISTPVDQLLSLVQELEHDDVELLYIHDY